MLSIAQLMSAIILATVVAALLTYWKRQSGVKYPNGPFTVPILGNIPQIIACGSLVAFLEKYRKIYGNVFSIEIGGVKRVVISGYENMQYLLVKNGEFTSNRNSEAMSGFHVELYRKFPGFMYGEADVWKPFRAFTHNVLRHEGMGKALMEPKILAEVEKFEQHFVLPHLGQPININLSITFATSNIICQMVAGKRYDYDDPELQRLNAAVVQVFKSSVKGSITKNIPFAKYLPFDFAGRRCEERAATYALEVARSWITYARQNLEADLFNFVHRSLLSREDENMGEEWTTSALVDGNIEVAAYSLYCAGTETTATALKWAFLYMTLYPDIQDRVREELQGTLGERTVTLMDRLSLPYVDAVFHETLRHSNISPLGLPHSLAKDLVVDGKTIPAGSDLMFNLTSVCRSAEIFPESHQFKPERFLADDGSKLKSKVISFGLGRRACLGESLARMEFFLFFVTFLQKYKLSHPLNEVPSLEPHAGLILAPKPYRILFEKI